MARVLFVCLGNICRSPMAEGMLRLLVETHGLGDAVTVASAGTHAYQPGCAPDPRAQAAALQRGVDLSRHQCRQVQAADLRAADYVLAMDRSDLAYLRRICPPQLQPQLQLLMEFAPQRAEREVPDPYCGGAGDFDLVLDMIEDAVRGVLEDIRRHRP